RVDIHQLPVDSDSTPKERRLYRLIWCNAIESCMTASTADRLRLHLTCPPVDSSRSDTDSTTDSVMYEYTSQVERLVFDGWRAVRANESGENCPDGTNDLFSSSSSFSFSSSSLDSEMRIEKHQADANYMYFENLPAGSVLSFSCIECLVQQLGTKTHYTEAHLVQLLERHGIGRPSTYASLIDKLMDKRYAEKTDIEGVKRDVREYRLYQGQREPECNQHLRMFGEEKGKMRVLPIGERVFDYIYQRASYNDECHTNTDSSRGKENLRMDELFSYEFTHHMESRLDDIESGDISWTEVCRDYSAELDRICAEESCDRQATETAIVHNKNDDDNGMNIDSMYDDDGCLQQESMQRPSEQPNVPRIRPLTDSMSVRQGKWGAYVHFQKPNRSAGMRRPTFLNIRKFRGDAWTCPSSELVEWLRTTYKMG
ncbi:MAG: type IA DNA topoisomerase, partial [Bacteroidetes bacterium]|nr:type IA DNA topoisomerase [Bacteroidota bacterium]